MIVKAGEQVIGADGLREGEKATFFITVARDGQTSLHAQAIAGVPPYQQLDLAIAALLAERRDMRASSAHANVPVAKPCPFCGTPRPYGEFNVVGAPWVTCSNRNCGAQVPVDMWNQRALAAIPPTPEAESGVDERLRMFLEILSAAGGVQDATDYRWNWINAFCGEHEGREPDTFNTANQRGFTTVSHDTDTDQGVVRLTDAGRAYLATPSPDKRLAASGEEERTLAAGRIIDVMTGGDFDWRAQLDESDFLESADWLTALAYADAALAEQAPPPASDASGVEVLRTVAEWLDGLAEDAGDQHTRTGARQNATYLRAMLAAYPSHQQEGEGA